MIYIFSHKSIIVGDTVQQLFLLNHRFENDKQRNRNHSKKHDEEDREILFHTDTSWVYCSIKAAEGQDYNEIVRFAHGEIQASLG